MVQSMFTLCPDQSTAEGKGRVAPIRLKVLILLGNKLKS